MKRIPVLAGPTASGKSGLALELARQLPLEIVSADAMLIYRGMDIGTAKPSLDEQARTLHHLIDIVNPDEVFSVADYVARAEGVIGEILARGKVPLLVGGTGFYIRALSQGLPTVPAADPQVQAGLWERYEREGLAPLERELERASLEDARRAGRNPRRVVRALEIMRRTGKPPSAFGMTQPAFSYAKLALLPAMDILKPRIEARTEAMFAAGLVAEVRGLLERYPKRPTATQAIGYKEVVAYLEGRSTLEEAKAAVTLATTQYAKRQRTWFRKEPGTKLLPKVGNEAFPEVLEWLEGVVEDAER